MDRTKTALALAAGFCLGIAFCMGATSAKADWFSVDFMSIIQSLEQSGCGDCSESQSASISQQ